ncbi:DNA topoisomerase III [Intestinibacter bartlettii]|uniref:DNA topoisomerase III n=1 Tax=Intestinibacter bartlettii TaxID=261299 RepID=UPI001D02CAB3|nr:DNA topoisomerase III [Intestinibacter bartlettii]MDU1254108.1 DNA topoisomerase III [Peptostreptococcaceae bacterium]MDU5919801.1 DNA topoisomerase III [Clostridiales bacterium]MCB5746148.1 DNA topoisomerase III [Intestinibacter bartlettii]MDU2693732.1 DNA topoisomerase III [Intestinibacter bartlettii]MDU4256409.1 DNA topoisomerase III [Intestinibacter bartlettii]
MGKILVLAEKPSVGRDIARVLGCKNEKNGYIEGSKYIVTWALGHLVTLADPETYDKKYKSWEMNDLPILPKELKTVVIKKTSKQFNTVKAQLNRNDVEEVVIATDAGREGELVARWIIEKAHIKKPIKRLWISSSTDKAIKEGFTKLRDGRDYNNLYYSAIARAEADWIVGINATRALTTKYNASLSCGRVQTPTLAIISKREDEIRNFKPKDYYTLDVLTEKGGSYLKLSWHDRNNSTSTFNKDKIEKIKKKVNNKDLKIVDVKKSNKKKYSPALYDLTELQRDANKIFGYSAKETLSIMQKLYEHHKVLTYPRTDSRYLTDDIVDTLKDRIKAVNTSEYSKVCMKLLKTKIKPNKSFVDNSKVSDHHAIIPTEERVFLGDLSDKERKIYDLVVKRFLSVLCPPFEYEQTTIKGVCEGEMFTANGNKINKLGWRENYTVEDDETYGGIIDVNVGEVLNIESVKIESKKTNPPSYLNEATLLTEMEKNNLGTVATRADIIEKLFNSFFVEMKNKEIHITSKGRQLLDLAPADLKSPELTAKWEKTLTDISKGKSKKNDFINQMKNYSKTIVKEIKNSENKFKHDNLTRNKCPNCGKFMLEVNGKRGKMLVCEDRECNTRKLISQTTNARCPNCHKRLELKGEGEGKIFTCSCGYREKLSSFNKRKSEEKGKASKKDINKYLKNQNKDQEVFNNPFAALANLKKK